MQLFEKRFTLEQNNLAVAVQLISINLKIVHQRV